MKINIKGPIVSSISQRYYDQEKIEAVSPARIEKELREAGGKDIELYINSNGGSVFAASEIYTLLKEYKGKVTAKIVGLAASAASFFVMAADQALISPLGQIMIHNASTSTYGNSDSHRSSYEMLSGTDKAIANVYRLKTKLPIDKLLELMNKTTWMNAEKAVELGFVDGVMFNTKEIEPFTQASYQEKKLPQHVQNIVDRIENKTLSNYVYNLSSMPMNEQPKSVPITVKTQTTRSDYFMNAADLQMKQPELYNEIVKLGMQQERQRVETLQNLAHVVDDPQMVQHAIQNGKDAGELAIDMVKNGWSEQSKYEAEAKLILMEAVKLMNENEKGR